MEIQHPADVGSFKITMADGREISLDAIHQRPTYAGLLEGYPSQEINDEVVEEDLNCAPGRMSVSQAAVLIQPAVKKCHGLPPTKRGKTTCPLLPAITTYAVFRSSPTLRNEGCGSTVLLVWYQERWGLPGPAILEGIKCVEWDRFAVDFDY